METEQFPDAQEGEARRRTASVLQEAYYQETLAKKTVELAFQEESAKQEKAAIEVQIDAVLSDLNPAVEALLKTCAKLTTYEGPISQLDLDKCIAKMEAEIRDLEEKNDIKHDSQDKKFTDELVGLWASLEKAQQLSAEEMWADSLMENKHGLGEKSTFRDQFREMMEEAVRRAVDSERQFNYSLGVWERNFQTALNTTTQRVEEDLRAAHRSYCTDRESKYSAHSSYLRADEKVRLSEISLEKDYVRGKIDVILDQHYSGLISRCQTMNRGFATEYQAMLNDLSEYRAAYQQAKNNLARATEPPRVSRNNRRDASPEKRTETENIPDKANISDKPIKTISAELGKSIRSNIFFGMVPKKTMAFEKFTRIHRLELEAIGDPAQRHLALSKRLKLDYAAQSGSVLKTADAAMEDLRAMYFKRIIGMRDAFVSGYASSGGADAPSVSTKHVSTLNKQACDDWS